MGFGVASRPIWKSTCSTGGSHNVINNSISGVFVVIRVYNRCWTEIEAFFRIFVDDDDV